MKKVLFVMNTLGLAGAEQALMSMLRAFDCENYDVSLLLIIDRGQLFDQVPNNVKVLNKNPSIKPVLGREGTFYIAKKLLKQMFRGGYIFKYLPYAVKNLKNQLKNGRFQADKLLWLLLAETTPALDEEYDLAIAYIEGASTYYVANKVNAKKKVSFLHVNYEKAGYTRELDYPYYKEIDYVFCVSEAIKRAFGKAYPEFLHKLKLFHNIVDPRNIVEASEKPGGYSDNFDGIRILTIGRLHPQKGFDIAIPAFARLLKSGYENVRWYVLGDGTEKSRLLSLIQKHDLQDKFILLGSVTNPYPYIKQSDIYIQPSRFEGFCLALQEAVLLNKPVITTNFDGVPNLLENGKDSLIISLSEDNIINALKTLLDNPEKRAGLSDATKGLFTNLSGDMNIIYDIINDTE